MAQQSVDVRAVDVRAPTECPAPTREQIDALNEAVDKMRAEWASRPFTEKESMAMIDQVTGINQWARRQSSLPLPTVIPLGPAPTREDIEAFVEAAEKVRAGWIAKGFTEEEIIAEIDEVTGIRK